MAFPKLAFLTGVAAGVAMRMLGQSSSSSLIVAVLVFMAVPGGMGYAKMVVKYLPRDLW